MIMHDYISLKIAHPAALQVGQHLREYCGQSVTVVTWINPYPGMAGHDSVVASKAPFIGAVAVSVKSVGVHRQGRITPCKRPSTHTLWLDPSTLELCPFNRYGYIGQPKRFVELITGPGVVTANKSWRIK